MEKYFDILLAGHIIRVNHLYDNIKNLCKDYIVENCTPEFSIAITKELLDIERKKSAIQREKENLLPFDFSDSSLEITAVYRLIATQLANYSIVVFHGSAVAVDDEVYLFTAKSGTGKTTHSRLWLKNIPNAYIVNGDKPMLEITQNGVIVHGTPWMGKEQFGKNTSARLKALCILERAENNSIEEISINQALPKLMSQTFCNNKSNLAGNLKFYSNVANTNSVSFYKLKCNMQDEAAFISYNKMSGKEV